MADDLDNSDDRISVEIPNISISDGDEDDMHGIQDIAIDLQAEDGLIQEEVVAMQQGSPSAMFKIKVILYEINARCYRGSNSIYPPIITASF